MKHIPICILWLLTFHVAFAQTSAQLLDSARHYKTSDFTKVITFAGLAYKKATENKQDDLQGQSALFLGNGNYLAGNYKEALRWYIESERILNKVGDLDKLAELYSEMCVFYVKNKLFAAADTVSQRAINYSTQVKDGSKLGTALNNRGLMFLDEGKADSAIYYFKASYGVYKKFTDKLGMAYSLDYLSSTLTDRGAYAEALNALTESKRLRAGMGDKTGEAIAINNIGELYLKENKPAEAVPFFTESVSQAHALKYPDLEVYGYSMLTQCYQQQGDFHAAYLAQNKYVELNQKFSDAKQSKAIAELQTRYETDKKEQQNKLLKAQNASQQIRLSRNRIGIYALLAISVLTGLLGYSLFNRYKIKQRAQFKEAMLEEQRLRSESILDAEENERQRLARELHDGVGQLLCAVRRQVETLEVGNDNDAMALKILDESIKEVRDISHSMMPPALLNKNLVQAIEEFVERLNHKGEMIIHTEWVNTEDLELDKTTTLMLYRSVQEIITNIFKHARATTINIEMVNHDTDFTLMIYDDGIGFDKEKVLNTGGGLGLKNIQSRIGYIGGNLQIDTMPEKGVTYIIELPVLVG
jgi:signal transduction histidine kinase